MEYGGITAIGLPAGWPVLVDASLAELPAVVIGSGVRHSKLVVPGTLLASLPGAEVVTGLGRICGTRVAQNATAAAAATLSESTPPLIGIRTATSAASSAAVLMPSPSAPSIRASFAGEPLASRATSSSRLTASSPQGQGSDGEARLAQPVQSIRPRLEPGPGHLEDGPHADPHRAPVQRVGAPRGDQDGVDAEPGGAAEHRSDVRVVGDVLQHRHPAGAAQDVVELRQPRPVHGGDRAPVDVEARDRLQRFGSADIDGRTAAGGRVRPGLPSAPASGRSAASTGADGPPGAPGGSPCRSPPCTGRAPVRSGGATPRR